MASIASTFAPPISVAVGVDSTRQAGGNSNDASRDVNVNASMVLHPCIGRSSHIGILFAHREVLVAGTCKSTKAWMNRYKNVPGIKTDTMYKILNMTFMFRTVLRVHKVPEIEYMFNTYFFPSVVSCYKPG